jgi:hypothetical protein
MERSTIGTSVNKAHFSGRLTIASHGMSLIPSAHGDLEVDGLIATGGGALSQRQGSCEASPGSAQ